MHGAWTIIGHSDKFHIHWSNEPLCKHYCASTQQTELIQQIAGSHLDGRLYYNLALTLSNSELIELHNKNRVSKLDLLLMAIRHEPDNLLAYHALANILPQDMQVRLACGRVVGKQQLHKMAEIFATLFHEQLREMIQNTYNN